MYLKNQNGHFLSLSTRDTLSLFDDLTKNDFIQLISLVAAAS